MNATIRIPVLHSTNKTPYDMTMSDPQNITAYFIQKNSQALMFVYHGDIYESFEISEERFLELCPHLKRPTN